MSHNFFLYKYLLLPKTQLLYTKKYQIFGKFLNILFLFLNVLQEVIEKHFCRSLFFNKVVGLQSGTLLKKENPAQVLCCESCKIFKNCYFTKYLWASASTFWRIIQNNMKKKKII